MTYLSAKDCAYVFFDGVDVKNSNNQLEITEEAVIAQRRPLGSAYKRSWPTGHYNGGLALAGWLDPDTSAALGALDGDTKIISALIGGNLASARFYGFQAAVVNGRKVGMAEDDLDTFEPVITADGENNFGFVVAPYEARTADGNTDTAYADIGAAATSGHAFLHVDAIALGGYTNCLITVRHSADHITFVNHTAFAAVTAIGAQVIALASAVNQYLSVSWAWAGAGADQSISAFVGVGVD